MKTKWLVTAIAVALGFILLSFWAAALSTQMPHASAAPAERAAGSGAAAPRASAAQINACGTITATTTWAPGNLYVANGCDVIVGAGYTLTIQPGVTARFSGTSSALIVFGALLAESSDALQPINFTSFADDAHGGDIDGTPGSAGSAGQWYGLHGRQPRPVRNVFIGYAGAGPTVCNCRGAGWNVAQVRAVRADVRIRNTLVTGWQECRHLPRWRRPGSSLGHRPGAKQQQRRPGAPGLRHLPGHRQHDPHLRSLVPDWQRHQRRHRSMG